MSLLGTTNPFGKDTWGPGAAKQYEASIGEMFPVVDANPEWRVEGRNIFGKVQTGASLGSQVVSESGDFPAASDSAWNEFKLVMSRLAHTVEVSFDEWELINSNSAAAIPVIESKTNDGVEQVTRDALRMMWMDGTARLARCAATAGSLTVNLQSSNGDAGSGNQVDRDRWNWLDTGRAKIDIVDATTGTPIANGTGRTIVSTTRDTGGNTITLDTAGGVVTTTTSHVIVWSKNVTGGGTYTSKEYPGILAALDTANIYLNINRATAGNDLWKGAVQTGTTAGTNEIPSLSSLHKVLHKITTNYGKQPSGQTHFVLYNLGVQASLLTYLAGAMRTTTDMSTQDFAPKGFQDYLPVLNMPGKADIHAPRNNLFVLCKTEECQFKFVRPLNQKFGLADFAPGPMMGMWYPKTGSTAGTYAAAAQAYIHGLLSLMTQRPNAHGRLTDITEQGVAY